MSPSASKASSAGLWVKRVAIALVAGVGIGAGTGMLGLKVLTAGAPPLVVEPEPTVPETPAPRRRIRGPRADGMRPGSNDGALVGGGMLASRDSIAVVPDLIGRAEGDARRLLQRAGFTLGTVRFREADEKPGTVLETSPRRGERLSLPAAVNLLLADRRRYEDPLLDPLSGNDVFRIPDPSVDTLSNTMPDTLSRMLSNTQPNTQPNTLPGPDPDTLPGRVPSRLPDTLASAPDTLP